MEPKALLKYSLGNPLPKVEKVSYEKMLGKPANAERTEQCEW
jgi:hypothetical protein